MMKCVAVDSTSIAAIGYDRGKRELGIEFLQSGAVYLYFEVPSEEHHAFMAAESKGKYLNRVFKTRRYRYSGPHPGRGRAA
jgi:hypothetical protein